MIYGGRSEEKNRNQGKLHTVAHAFFLHFSLFHHWGTPGKTCIGKKGAQDQFRSQLVCCAFLPSCFSHVRLFATPWTIARQAPLFIGFSRQEYWNGLLCPPPGDLPNSGMEAPVCCRGWLIGVSPNIRIKYIATAVKWMKPGKKSPLQLHFLQIFFYYRGAQILIIKKTNICLG